MCIRDRYDYWRSYCYNFLRSRGMSEERLRRREHSPEELCHYSNGTWLHLLPLDPPMRASHKPHRKGQER